MRIGVDAHVLGARKTGNERFVAGVISALAARGEHDIVAFLTQSDAPLPPGVERVSLRLSGRVARHVWSLSRAARLAEIDVLLTQYLVPWRAPCPVVPVIHDVSFATNPEYFSPTERAWMPRMIPSSARRAAHILTVSEFSRGELVRECSVPKARVTVAFDGVDPALVINRPPVAGPPYFLAVGNVQPRKNLAMLVQAYAQARAAHEDLAHELLIVGQDAWGSSAVHDAARDVPGVRFLGYVDDERLAGLLQHATALAYPSRYEGFGLPVIEALAVGTPAVVADIPVMREIAKDAAFRVKPDDIEGWAEVLALAASDPGFRAQRAGLGRAVAARYTWDATAVAVTSALTRAASDGRPTPR